MGNRTSWCPIRSVIILVIKQIGLPLRGRPILLITRMTTDRIGLHSVLLPSQISPNRMRKYYSGEILFCGVLRRYVSQNIVAITGTLRLNRFVLLYVFN